MNDRKPSSALAYIPYISLADERTTITAHTALHIICAYSSTHILDINSSGSPDSSLIALAKVQPPSKITNDEEPEQQHEGYCQLQRLPNEVSIVVLISYL